MPNPKYENYSEDKKIREHQLIEEFLRICPDFDDYKFVRFSENPDMVYQKGSNVLGFDSVIISDDQASIDCYFEESMCQIGIPSRLSEEEKNDKITIFFENKLFKHFRRYDVPTVLVFSLVDTEPTTYTQLINVAKRFALPEFEMFNIVDYYITDSHNYQKITKTKPI